MNETGKVWAAVGTVLVALGAQGCHSEEAPTVSYDPPKPSVAARHEFVVPLPVGSSPSDEPPRIPISVPVDRGSEIAVTGEIPTTNSDDDMLPLVVKIRRPDRKGQYVTFAQAGGIPTRDAEGRVRYQLRVTSPKENTGKFEVVVISGRDRIVARGELEVR